MPKITIKCEACDGTGLYCGFAEPKGTAVICRACGGAGWKELRYRAFTRRRRKRGVKRVMGDSGLWFIRNGKEKTISVTEFYAIKMKEPTSCPRPPRR